MFREVRGESDYHGSGLHAMNRQYTQFLVVVIEEGRASGEFRADLPTALLRDMVYGATEHHSWNYVCGRGALDIDTLADQITSILCDGISRAGGKLEGRRRLSKRAAHLESQFEKRNPRNRSRARVRLCPNNKKGHK